MKILLATCVLIAVIAGGCTSRSYDVPYIRAVQELVLAYPRFDGNAPVGDYGPMTDHPAYDRMYGQTLNVRHVVVVSGQECRAEITNASSMTSRKTYVSIRRIDDNRIEVVTYSELTGKAILWPMRDLGWETRQLSSFGTRLKRMEPPR